MREKTTKTKIRKPKITAKQEGGDDGYCWAVRCDGKLVVDGLTRAQVAYYKERILREWNEKYGKLTPVKTLGELRRRAVENTRYADLACAACHNLGGPDTKDVNVALNVLEQNASAVEFEGVVDDGEKTIVDEVNFCIDLVR